MKLKTLIATSAVAVAMASSAIANECTFTGFNLGVNVGYGTGSANSSYSNVAGTNTISNNLSLKGVVGGVQAGYIKEFGKFVAGLEATFNLSNTQGKVTATTAVPGSAFFKVNRRNAFGLAANLGTKLNNWLLYVKLGWESANFKLTSGSSATNSTLSKSKRLNGFAPGLGVATMLTHNVMFGVEWTYAFYSKQSGKASNGDRSSYTPRIADVKLKLGYKF
jgi:outer membrane immunogenic protein